CQLSFVGRGGMDKRSGDQHRRRVRHARLTGNGALTKWTMTMSKEDDERKAIDAYLGKNIRRVEPNSSLLQSTSRWLNHGKVREVIPIWLLRKNGPDFPVEADHTLGLATAFSEVVPPAEVAALMEQE